MLQVWLREVLHKKWRNTPGLRQAKRILKSDPPEEWIVGMEDLSRNGLRLAVGWLTRH